MFRFIKQEMVYSIQQTHFHGRDVTRLIVYIYVMNKMTTTLSNSYNVVFIGFISFLILWSRVFDSLIVTRLLKISAFCETRSFITVFTSGCHWNITSTS
jgi:hypothetical protein